MSTPPSDQWSSWPNQQTGPVGQQSGNRPPAGQPAWAGQPTGPAYPQQPSGAQPYGQQPYGQVPYGPPLTNQKPGRKKRLIIRFSVLAVLVVVGIVIAVINSKSDPGEAKAGDCIGNVPAASSDQTVTVDDAKKVDCTSSDARYKVLGTLNKSESDFNSQPTEQMCAAYPDAIGALYVGDSGSSSSGTVLCLGNK